MKSLLLLLPHLSAISLAAAASPWGTDLHAAMQQAQQEQQLVMLEFTGSDWCSPCMQLKSKVLGTPAFAQYAAEKKLILVELDIPHGATNPPELKERNQAQAARFNISGYPTVLILTPQGTVVGGFMGARSQVEVQKSIEEAAARAARLAPQQQAADQAQGLERAKALQGILEQVQQELPAELALSNVLLREAILTADTADTLGYRAAEERRVAEQKFRAAILEKLHACNTQPRPMIAAIDDILQWEGLLPHLRGEMMHLQGSLLLQEAADEAELNRALELIQNALPLLPERVRAHSEKRYQQSLDTRAKRLEQIKPQKP